MKNKKWKREAKRLKGHCIQIGCCIVCPSFRDCVEIVGRKTPEYQGIRDLERRCKTGRVRIWKE